MHLQDYLPSGSAQRLTYRAVLSCIRDLVGWLETSHPDAEGQQLQLLCEKLGSLYHGKGLLGACRAYGLGNQESMHDHFSD